MTDAAVAAGTVRQRSEREQMPHDVYESVFRDDGWLEIRETNNDDAWIAANEPIDVVE